MAKKQSMKSVVKAVEKRGFKVKELNANILANLRFFHSQRQPLCDRKGKGILGMDTAPQL